MPTNYRELARQAAAKYGLIPDVFERQIEAESGFNPGALSSAGARGIAQIMPATARGWGVNPDDPNAALNAAAKNMAGYIKTFLGGANPESVTDPVKLRDAYEKGLRAYNAGPGAVEASRKYAETNRYVQKIIGPDKFSFTEALKGKQQPQQQQPQQVSSAQTPGGITYNIYVDDNNQPIRTDPLNFLRNVIQPPGKLRYGPMELASALTSASLSSPTYDFGLNPWQG
jgi:hypothetical protein